MSEFDTFSQCILKHTRKIIDRAACFVWFRFKLTGQPSSISEIADDFAKAGLARPNVTTLKRNIRKDRRFVKSGNTNKWRLRNDKMKSIEETFNLQSCLGQKVILKSKSDSYVDKGRLDEIKALKSSEFDFSRLIKMLNELNSAFDNNNYISVIALLRAVIDHVPPLFGHKSFKEVANNYSGSRSFKRATKNLEIFSRDIADSYLHTQIRQAESLPTKTQVDFTNVLDTLLSEIVRLIKEKEKRM